MLHFNDGMKFDLRGGHRIVHKSDGWYVAGHGMLIPVKDEEEGKKMIKEMNDRREP